MINESEKAVQVHYHLIMSFWSVFAFGLLFCMSIEECDCCLYCLPISFFVFYDRCIILYCIFQQKVVEWDLCWGLLDVDYVLN